MNRTGIACALLILFGTVSTHAASADDLVKALESSFHVIQVNGLPETDEGGFDLIYSEESPEESAIPQSEVILNGLSWKLVACSGNILGSGLKAYAVGTAVEGPTFGHLLIFNGRFKRVAAIDCQKVVRMKLLDLLGDSSREIVTWEDHHYGTNTTRRTLVIYKVRGKEISKVFEHDLVDQTHVSHGQVGSPDEPRFEIDLESMKSEKVILVKSDRGEMSRYRWTGNKYEMTCQQGR